MYFRHYSFCQLYVMDLYILDLYVMELYVMSVTCTIRSQNAIVIISTLNKL